jgi:hypothetical protein
VKKLALLLCACALFFIPHKAHAQGPTTLERCQANQCFGFGPPVGAAQNGYIYQDLSQNPPALYCGKGGSWAACGGTGGTGLTSFTTSDLPPLFTVTLGGSPTTAPAQVFTLSNAGQNFFFAGPASGGSGAPSYRAIAAADIPTSLPAVSIGGNAASATLAANSSAVGGVALAGLCQSGGSGCPAGGSGLSGQVAGSPPEANSSTTANGPFPMDDEITNTGFITLKKNVKVQGSGTANGLVILEGTALSGVASSAALYPSSTTHRWMQNPNNTGATMIPGVATAGTSAHLVAFASNGIDLVDGGAAPASIANVTITGPTSAIAANTCTTAATVTMTGVTTSMAFTSAFATSPVAVTGWGANGGLTLALWPTANTVNWSVCNQTASSITPGAMTFNVGAK